MIAGDTGPLHLASVLQRPSVGLFGPTDPVRTGAWGNSVSLRGPGSVTDHRRHTETEAGLARLPVEAVLHAFEARSPDELTFAKGDKIELIERDDDFGDGWYLGKHVGDGRTGLFPEGRCAVPPRALKSSHSFIVYTKLAPPVTQVATPATTQVRATRAASTPNVPPPFSTASKQASGAYDGRDSVGIADLYAELYEGVLTIQRLVISF